MSAVPSPCLLVPNKSPCDGRNSRLPGYVYDANDKVQYTVHGTWDQGLVCSPGRIERAAVPNIQDAFAVRIAFIRSSFSD